MSLLVARRSSLVARRSSLVARRSSPQFAPVSLFVLLIATAGCKEGEESGEAGSTTVGICETEPYDGVWEIDPTGGEIIDWSVPVPSDGWQKVAPYGDILEHHQSLTAVHAAHLPTGELMLFHGQGEERVWPIGAPYSEMRWHPVPYTVPKIGFPDLCSYDDDVNQTDLFQGGADGECYADIFCAGHVQLYDGRFLVAGGNVDSTATGGGLKHTFTYMPWEGVPNGQRSGPDLVEGPFAAGENPFSWDKHGDMAVDRWYPTLTVLRDGTVLISSGASRLPYLDGQNTFELFDPETNLVAPLNITNTPFSQANPIPLYPFMFLLPNGDILYAGGEEATVASSNGRVLIPGYNNNGTWTWDERVFESTINGGSAVMYEPGKIMKSGGLHRGSQNDDPPILDEDNIARVETEIIDLSKFASGDYGIAGQKDAATDFLRRGDMNQPRHFHNLTLLPDGRVLATGGNKRSNGFAGDDELNECEYQNQPIADMDLCNDTNRDGTPDNPATAAAGCPAVPSRCLAYDPQGPLLQGNYCPLRGNTTCPDLDHVDCGAPCTNNDDTQCPPGSTCGDAGTCEMPCPEPGGEMCGAVVHCSGGLSYCDPAKNECHATQSFATRVARRPRQERKCHATDSISCLFRVALDRFCVRARGRGGEHLDVGDVLDPFGEWI